MGSSPTDFVFPLFFGEKQNGKNVFASVRAEGVNGYYSLLLSTTVVRGEGREPRRSLLRNRRESTGGLANIAFVGDIELPTDLPSHRNRRELIGGLANIYFLGYIELPTDLPSRHDDLADQWVVLYNQQKICLRVRQFTLADFATGISEALVTSRSVSSTQSAR